MQGEQAWPKSSAEETEIADLHKAAGQNVLQKAVNEFLGGEGAVFEFSRTGRSIGEGDLGRFHTAGVKHFDQTPVAESHPIDVRSQVLESGLAIAHCFAVHDPIQAPNFGRDLCEESGSAQEMLEASAE